MMSIYITQLALPIMCFIIGVVCGRRSITYKEDFSSEVRDDDGT